MKQDIYNLYLISDASGETVKAVVRACLGQFLQFEVKEHVYSLIRIDSQMEKIISEIKEKAKKEKVIVFYSMVNKPLRESLIEEMEKENIIIISILREAIHGLTDFFCTPPDNKPGTQYLLDEDYFNRIDAMEFALTHDDGQALWGLEKADVILVGVSRTSKTPTCMYLANRGIKAANVPFVKDIKLPDYLYNKNRKSKPYIFGLITNPGPLIAVRQARLEGLSFTTKEGDHTVNYIDPLFVREEIREARKFFQEYNIKTIDTSHRSIEEVSAYIISEMSKN